MLLRCLLCLLLSTITHSIDDDMLSFLTLGSLRGKETDNEIRRNPRRRHHHHHESNPTQHDSSLLEVWDNKGYPIIVDDTDQPDRIPLMAPITDNKNTPNMSGVIHRSIQPTTTKTTQTSSLMSRTTLLLRGDDKDEGHVDDDDDNISFDVITCYFPKGSTASLSRRICPSSMMLNSDDDESSSSSNPSPLTAPDAQLSCSRRLTPSNVIDFIYGNQPIQKIGKTLDFTNEGTLRNTLTSMDKDTTLHMLFNDCLGDTKSLPDLDDHNDYMALVIVNSNAERDGMDRIDQHHATTIIGTSSSSSSIVSYKTVILFYPIQFFFHAGGYDVMNRRRSDIVNTLMYIDHCGHRENHNNKKKNKKSPSQCINDMSDAGRDGDGEDGATLAVGYITLIYDNNNISGQGKWDESSSSSRHGNGRTQKLPSSSSSSFLLQSWDDIPSDDEDVGIDKLSISALRGGGVGSPILSTPSSTSTMRGQLRHEVSDKSVVTTNVIDGGDSSNSKHNNRANNAGYYTLCYIPRGYAMISRRECSSSSSSSSSSSEKGIRLLSHRRGWGLDVPSQSFTCSKAFKPSYIASSITSNDTGKVLDLSSPSSDIIRKSIDKLDKTLPIRLLFGSCDEERALPDLRPDKDYIALVYINNRAVSGSSYDTVSSSFPTVSFKTVAIFLSPDELSLSNQEAKEEASSSIMDMYQCAAAGAGGGGGAIAAVSSQHRRLRSCINSYIAKHRRYGTGSEDDEVNTPVTTIPIVAAGYVTFEKSSLTNDNVLHDDTF